MAMNNLEVLEVVSNSPVMKKLVSLARITDKNLNVVWDAGIDVALPGGEEMEGGEWRLGLRKLAYATSFGPEEAGPDGEPFSFTGQFAVYYGSICIGGFTLDIPLVGDEDVVDKWFEDNSEAVMEDISSLLTAVWKPEADEPIVVEKPMRVNITLGEESEQAYNLVLPAGTYHMFSIAGDATVTTIKGGKAKGHANKSVSDAIREKVENG